MKLEKFLQQLRQAPDNIIFNDTMTVIENHYEFTPTRFKNGSLHNEAGKNSGSCKIFSFARLHGLSKQQTLHCFGSYYREDVLNSPDGSDHQNIRNFMRNGWDGIEFEGDALTPKQPIRSVGGKPGNTHYS